jgi:phosphate-selective porin OprO and OprP
MTLHNCITKLAIAGAIGLTAGIASAGDYSKAIIDDKMPIEAWEFCDIFDIPTLYESDSGFIRSVALTGRYHGQWISQTEDIGATENGYHEYQHRRFRQGIEIGFANDITFSATANISDGTGSPAAGAGGPGAHGLTYGRFFDDWDEFAIEWAPSKDHYLIVGKQKQKVTIENETSSNKILTIERSAIASEVISDKPWGITYGFKALDIKHEIGAWMVGADNDSRGEGWLWPDGDSRGSITYRASKKITDEVELHFDYQFTNNSDGLVPAAAAPIATADAGLGSAYEHVVALGSKSAFGEFGLITDLIFAGNRQAQAGGGGAAAIPTGDNTYGLVIMPYYNITDKLQAVVRYAYMDSGREQRPQRFNTRRNVEDYSTVYAGLNYYVCGDNLKLMAGYEYANGNLLGSVTEIDTSSWQLGMRISY